MLVELEMIPMRSNSHLSDVIAEVASIIDGTELSYALTPSGTCIEGTWEDVMPVIRQCHERARELSPHVFTYIRIEDEEGATNKLKENIISVQEQVKKSGQRLHPALSMT